MGGASGMPTIKITTAIPGGSAIGVSQNTYALNLFNPAAYNTGAATSNGQFAAGAGAELAASISASDYITEGIIDALGHITDASITQLSATAGTLKGGPADPYGNPEDDEFGGGRFGGGDNSSDGGAAGSGAGAATAF